MYDIYVTAETPYRKQPKSYSRFPYIHTDGSNLIPNKISLLTFLYSTKPLS